MTLDRRRILGGLILGGLGAASAISLFPSEGFAQTDELFPLKNDAGDPLGNHRLPSEPSINGLRGIIWIGSKAPDVTLVEFFDYNCPWCRKAAPDLDAFLSKDRELRLGLVNNPILSIGSLQAAKVQQAILKLYGPQRAYEFHKKMLAHRGENDGPGALAIAKAMSLKSADIESAADGDDIRAVLKAQVSMAENLGLSATPSFVLNGVGVMGYPGPQSTAKMISSVRKCDQLACS